MSLIQVKYLFFAIAIGVSFAVGAYAQNFPNLRGAQASLQDAVEHLERAPNRFGGHKAQAIWFIIAANDEINQAMEFAVERGR